MTYVFNPFTSNFDYIVPSSVPKYVLTNESVNIDAFGQYVIHAKQSLTLNGIAMIILNEGSELIVI